MRGSIQRFEVRAQLGVGGMGTVYLAHDPQLERDVAIKVLLGRAAERSELSTEHTIDLRADGARSALLGEARMMARLSHPNIVPVYEVGLDGDSVFVVMEHVDGHDLRAWGSAAKRTTADVLRVFAQAAEGLAAAHARGIVHRDFKPDNVLIGADGRARVADFGLSRLISPATELVRADPAGTPRYMAPELWDGGAPTPAADTFAYCVSLAEMFACQPDGDVAKQLAAYRVPRPVRMLVAAGLSQDPAKRPKIGELASELSRRAANWPVAIAAGLAVATVVLGVVAAVRLGGNDAREGSCVAEPTLFARYWNDAVKSALRPWYEGDARVDQMLAAVDARVAGLTEAHHAACVAASDNQITEAQRARRQSCIERRAMEIGGRARYYAAAKRPTSLELVAEHLVEVWQHEWCDVVNAPPLPIDPALRARVESLHQRHWDVWALRDGSAIEPVAALHAEALALDQRELALSLGITRASRLENIQRLDEAAQVLDQTSALATEVGNPQFEVLVLLERSTLAGRRGDRGAALQLAQLGLEKANKPGISLRTRAIAHNGLAYAQAERGDPTAALATARAGLAAAQQHGRSVDGDIGNRVQILNALEVLGRYPEAAEFATESAARSLALLGADSVNHAVMLDRLGRAQSNAGQHDKSLATRQQALAILRRHYGPIHTRVVSQEVELANDFSQANRLAEAHAMCERAVKLAEEHRGAFDSVHGWYSARLAETTFELGRHELAIVLMERAIELLVAQHGPDHPLTHYNRAALGEYRLELGRLDAAQRDFDALVASYQRRPEPNDKRPASVRGELFTALALARNKPADAEKLARDALAELVERKADDREQRVVRLRLGAALVAQGKASEALPILDEVVALARKLDLREDVIAVAELELARAELAAGKRDAGRDRALRVQAMLARWPGQVRARAAVAKLAKP